MFLVKVVVEWYVVRECILLHSPDSIHSIHNNNIVYTFSQYLFMNVCVYVCTYHTSTYIYIRVVCIDFDENSSRESLHFTWGNPPVLLLREVYILLSSLEWTEVKVTLHSTHKGKCLWICKLDFGTRENLWTLEPDQKLWPASRFLFMESHIHVYTTLLCPQNPLLHAYAIVSTK